LSVAIIAKRSTTTNRPENNMGTQRESQRMMLHEVRVHRRLRDRILGELATHFEDISNAP
jgi:hypothetical protein